MNPHVGLSGAKLAATCAMQLLWAVRLDLTTSPSRPQWLVVDAEGGG